MSVFLKPVTFKTKKIAASDDAAEWACCISDGFAGGCSLTKSGNTLTIGAGRIIACGRQSRADEAKSFTVSGTTGYARLLLTIDLSENDPDQQIELEIENANSIAAFPSLIQQDVNNGGTKYQMTVCMMQLSASGIAAILYDCGKAHALSLGKEISLPASGWSNNQQTVYVSGVTPRSNVLVTAPIVGSGVFNAAKIDAVAYGEGWVTFACQNVPSADATAYLLIS